MESGKQPMDPSLALINDEILSTQVRLMELYVKQAQATAANEAAKAQERFQAELTALQTELKQKNLALESQKALFHQTDRNLKAGLRARLLGSQRLLEARETDLGTTDAQALRQRIAQLESTVQKTQLTTEIEAARARERWQAELAALKGELERTESPLSVIQTSLDEVEGTLGAEIQDLRSQLAAKVELLEHRTAELQNARTQIALLQQRIQQLELTGAQTEEAVSEATRIRKTLQAELVALRTAFEQKDLTLQQTHTAATELERRLNLQLRGLQSQLAEQQGLLETRSQEIGEFTTRINDLQEQIARLELANKQTVEQAQSAARTLQDGLRAHLQELEATVSEKAELLQNRTAELQSAQAETARLRERITQLELNGAQTEAARNEGERVRQAVQNELADVQRALEQTKASLTQREAEFQTSSERLNAELNNLKNQLAEKSDALETQKHELLSAKSEITTLGDRMHKLEHAKTTGERNASLEIERLRERHQTELAGLRADLAQRQLALEKEQTRARVLEEKLKDDLHQLGAQLTEKQRLLHRGDQELQEQRSEIAALREELARTEFARRQTEMLVATQAEQIRERVKAEVEALDAQLREKENALKSLADREQELSLRIDDLRQQLAQKESLIESRDIEVTHLRTQAGDLLAQIIHLERAHAETLEQQRVAASQLEQNLRAQVDELQNQLMGKLALLETRNREVQALESRVTELADRIDRSEIALEQARAIAVSEIEQIRQQSQAALTARQEEVERKVEGLQDREAALYAAEQSFKVEIDALRKEVAEKRFLLENRNEQLLRVKMEMDELQDRIGYLESVARQAELESRHKDERSEEQPRPELEKLRQKLSQKEQMLKQRQTAVNDSEPGLQAQINSLRSELAEKQALLENPRSGFLIGEPTLTESQKERLSRLEQLVETIKADNEQTLISPHNRKWRFSLSRKRRWKS
jgi:chromosome segregation ATPase